MAAHTTTRALFQLTGKALRLFGRESIGSWFEQSLVARRQEDFAFRAETRVDVAPTTYQQSAGLTLYYSRHKFHYLAISWDEQLGRSLSIMSCLGDWPDGRMDFPLADAVPLPQEGAVSLAAEVRFAALQFFVDAGAGWQPVGPLLDASVVSDEAGRGAHGSFTGAFVGMLAFDTSGAGLSADFTRFEYRPL